MRSILLTVLVGFLTINVGVLYYIVLFGDVPKFENRLELVERRVDSLIKRDGPMVDVPEVQVGGDLVVLSEQQKQELINGALAAAQIRISELVDRQVRGKVAGAREYYVPLGQARVKTSDYTWHNTSVQADFDRLSYGEEAKVYFEASLSVPTGNGFVEARLVDIETGEVQGSLLKSEASVGSFMRSEKLELEGGLRKLVLQMRTSMDYEGVLEGGRLRIVFGDGFEEAEAAEAN